MEPTYTILGGDGNKYGPVTAEQFREWARDGRVGAQTQVWRSDTPAWCAAAALPELGVAAPGVTAIPAPTRGKMASHDPALEGQIKNGASWFYWIAALSLINSIVTLTGSSWGFAIGLGITRITDSVAAGFDSGGKAIAIVFDLVVVGVLVLFGVFANKRHLWAFIVGMVLLAFDAVITGVLRLWLSVAFHAWALFAIFRGLQACRASRG